MEPSHQEQMRAHRRESLLMRLYGLLALGGGLGLVYLVNWAIRKSDLISTLLLLPGVVGTALVVYGPWLIVGGSVYDAQGELVPWKQKINLSMAGLAVYSGFCFAGVWAWRAYFEWPFQKALVPGMLSVMAVFVGLFFLLRKK